VPPSPHVRYDAYVLDVLLPDLVGHNRHPSAFLVYLHLWRRTRGGRGKGQPVTLRAIAEATGLSKRAVQDALATLARRRLVAIERAAPTAVPVIAVLRPWERRRAG
jgi:hypothetical protein